MDSVTELRQIYADGRYQDAWQRYVTEQDHPDPAWHMFGAMAAWKILDRYRARVAGERGLSRDPQGDVFANLRFVTGSVQREIGDYACAVDILTDLLDGWDAYPGARARLEGPALHNLALTYRCQRRFAEALSASRRAALSFQATHSVDFYRQTMQNQAWILCEMGDGTGAQDVLDQVDSLCVEGAALQQQQLGRGYVGLLTGDLVTVDTVTAAVLQHNSASRDVLAQAAWLRGRGYLAAGNLTEAWSWGRVAQEWAAQSGESRLMSYACQLLLAVRDQQPQGA